MHSFHSMLKNNTAAILNRKYEVVQVPPTIQPNILTSKACFWWQPGMNSQKSNFLVKTEHTIFQYLPLHCVFTTQEIDTMLFLIQNRDFPNRNQVTCTYISSPRLSVNKTHCLPELATVNLEIKTNGLILKFSHKWASVTEENGLYFKSWKFVAG